MAKIETNFGTIEIELMRQDAPRTVDNFNKLVSAGFYDGVRFHRVIKDFMIQTGDPLSKDTAMMNAWGTGGPGYTIPDEHMASIVRGVVAMANAGPNTGGSQFFIVTIDKADWLNGKHAVFGKVVKGMDVVDAIEKVQTTGQPFDRPLQDVIIKKITLE